jgi:hypothetical protein
MSADAWITLVVLVVAFGVLATERAPTAVVMAGAVGVLLLTGVLTQSEALSGLSSSAPVTIAALYVIAGAATVTGALSPISTGSWRDPGTGTARAPAATVRASPDWPGRPPRSRRSSRTRRWWRSPRRGSSRGAAATAGRRRCC